MTKWTSKDLFALQALSPLVRAYVPWTEWSLRPSVIVTILNHLATRPAPQVLECGGGSSTYFLAAFLAEREGRLRTVESDPAMATQLDRDIRQRFPHLDLEIVTAAVQPRAGPLGPSRWYDDTALETVVEGPPLDALVVDGPPAGDVERAVRHPALGVFANRIGDTSVVVLDDVDRAGEQEVLSLWQAECPQLTWRVIDGFYAIGQRPDTWLLHL
jgi:hypothetical protein